MGWKNETQRHSMARKGVRTKKTSYHNTATISPYKKYFISWTNTPIQTKHGLIIPTPQPDESSISGTPKQIRNELEKIRKINSGNDWTYRIYDINKNDVTSKMENYWDNLDIEF